MTHSLFLQFKVSLERLPKILGAAMLLIFAGYVSAQNKPEGLQAGAALSNITPFLDGGIVGNFGTPPEAKQIHDEMFAKCLVLDDGTTQLAIVIVDNLSIAREVLDKAKELIAKHTPIKKENILIAATHTHSGTSSSGVGAFRMSYNYDRPLDEYQQFLARRISDGVRRAIGNKEPAKIAWGSTQVPKHVFNRRWRMKPGTNNPNPFGGQDEVVMNPGVANPNLLEPAGPVDPELSYVSVQSLDNRPIAVLANYSLHYVGGVPNDHISADYFGVFADRLQQLIGADRLAPPFVAMMSNGTSGNINNINFRGPAERMPAYKKMQLVANDVAQEVYNGYQKLTYKADVKLGAAYSELALAVRKPTPAMLARAREVVAHPDIKTVHRLESTYAQRMIQLQDEWPEKVNIVLQVLKIGDLGIAAIPFETFAETGLEIKAKSPFKPSFTIELAHGNYGYLPTPEQHKLGGYETWIGTNRVETDASTKITARILELFKSLK